jgi:hypothetical protein
LSDCIDTELALSALRMAASTRGLAPGRIHHTDRDCRYGSDDYLAALKQLGARPSMSRKGDCWDNAVSESFFATLEKELLALQPLQSRRNTREQVANYIENYYNLVRLHSHLDYVSPIEFETNASSPFRGVHQSRVISIRQTQTVTDARSRRGPLLASRCGAILAGAEGLQTPGSRLQGFVARECP